jgi:HEPN domain-containing protein
MKNSKIDINKTVNHWITASDRDFGTIIHLYEAKDYHWALFIGHLVIERLLKAGVVTKTKDHAPFTHDLRKLAKLSGIEFDQKQIKWFDTISTFNLNVRT